MGWMGSAGRIFSEMCGAVLKGTSSSSSSSRRKSSPARQEGKLISLNLYPPRRETHAIACEPSGWREIESADEHTNRAKI